MHFKQKLVTDRRQNDVKLYSSISHKHSQPKQSFNQRLQQQYQINKENQSSNPQKYTKFQSIKYFQNHHHNNQKNQYGFSNSNSLNKVNHYWIDRNHEHQRNKSKSNRILIQQNDQSQNASNQYIKDHEKSNHFSNYLISNNNKYKKTNNYQNQNQVNQHQVNSVYIDKAFLTKSIQAKDIKGQNSQIYINPLSNSKKLSEKKLKIGQLLNVAKTSTNKKNFNSKQKTHIRHQSVNLNNESVRPITFGLVQNCSMVKSQKWQPLREDQQSQQIEHHYSQIKKQTEKCSLLNSKQYIQQKMLKQQILDQIIMKRSVQKQYNHRGISLKTQPNVELTKSQECFPMNNNSLMKFHNYTMINNSDGKQFFMDSVTESFQNDRLNHETLSSINMNPSISCNNHPNKKAKYRLLSSEQEMLYCSKCAINLLQQGFKVEELKKDLKIKVRHQFNMTQSLRNPGSNSIFYQNEKKQSTNLYQVQKRTKELQNFESKITQTESKIHQMLSRIDQKNQINQITKQIESMEKVFQNFIKNLQKIKEKQIGDLQLALNKQKHQANESKNQLLGRLGSLQEIKHQLNQYRNKFINMEQNQYHFLLDSFLNKVASYEQNPRKEKNTTMKKHMTNKNSISQISNHRRIDTQNQIEKIITELYHRLIDKTGVQISFDKKQEQQSFDYYCQETKQPFRSLFNDQQQEYSQKFESTRNQSGIQQKSNMMKNKIQDRQQTDSPTFQKYE